MKRRWFETWGWVYRPVTWQGYVVALLALAFSLQVFLAVDSQSHSVSDTLYGIIPYIAPCWILIFWVASRTSRSED